MHRQIARYSYWIGVVCVVIDVVWRIVEAIWVQAPGPIHGVWRETFRNAAIVFLMLSVASVAHAWLLQQTMPAATEKKGAVAG
ncbi:MAG TPA: hypothetical protein VMS96_08150 [Terriglobales bacterium]|nr:hypothetical protein [Terriglobales bacterium]